jgi:uncharacterized protein (UPF0335 family)
MNAHLRPQKSSFIPRQQAFSVGGLALLSTQFIGTSREPEAFKNSVRLEHGMADVGGIAGERLRAFVERVERLEEEKAALVADIKEVYAEAKGVGFDVKILRKIIGLRKLDKSDRQEQEEVLAIYLRALDME